MSYLIAAKRTPMGKFRQGLAPVRTDDLMALLWEDFLKQDLFDPRLIDDIIVGCANQAGEDNRNIARMSALLAGMPHQVPGTTINRLCGSSLDAVIGASGRISLGLADCILVGGVESMSRAPYVISKPETPWGNDAKMYDSTLGWRFPNPKMKALFPLESMGETAENVAKKLKISREKQDQFAFESHQKAISAQTTNAFDKEILPVSTCSKKSKTLISKDEGPREDTSLEKLSKLKAVFCPEGTVTAGNSSPLSDGAAMVAIVSERFLKTHNLTPLLKITSFGIKGVEPQLMGLGPVAAVKDLCQKYNKKVSDFDIVELNEAFAAQSLGCIQELNLDPKCVNKNGGAIALGHPLGCSGARILTTLTHLMIKNPSFKEGLATMCIGVGQGIALGVKNCLYA